MKIERDERKFDFHGIGLAIKKAREREGMTQEQLGYIVDRDPRTIAPIDQPYEYPITQSDPEWSSLSTSEKKSLCQIETSVLRRLTTPALLETVLNYPYLIDVFAWGDMSIGIETLAANFNGMEELLARADLERSLENYCNTHSSHNIAYQVAEYMMQNNI